MNDYEVLVVDECLRTAHPEAGLDTRVRMM
jgi:hypothetical protein